MSVIERPQVDVETLDYCGSETHSCAIEGEIVRHYFDCPNPVCSAVFAAWAACPACHWYDESAWERTLDAEGLR